MPARSRHCKRRASGDRPLFQHGKAAGSATTRESGDLPWAVNAMLRTKAGRLFLLSFVAAAALPGADAPRRIVSMSPNLTEILYGIGAFDRVAGISDYCTWPPEVRNLPTLGGWVNPNLEKIAALHPDLVVVDQGQAPFVA